MPTRHRWTQWGRGQQSHRRNQSGPGQTITWRQVWHKDFKIRHKTRQKQRVMTASISNMTSWQRCTWRFNFWHNNLLHLYHSWVFYGCWQNNINKENLFFVQQYIYINQNQWWIDSNNWEIFPFIFLRLYCQFWCLLCFFSLASSSFLRKLANRAATPTAKPTPTITAAPPIAAFLTCMTHKQFQFR